jgi:hypothetical protein
MIDQVSQNFASLKKRLGFRIEKGSFHAMPHIIENQKSDGVKCREEGEYGKILKALDSQDN